MESGFVVDVGFGLLWLTLAFRSGGSGMKERVSGRGYCSSAQVRLRTTSIISRSETRSEFSGCVCICNNPALSERRCEVSAVWCVIVAKFSTKHVQRKPVMQPHDERSRLTLPLLVSDRTSQCIPCPLVVPVGGLRLGWKPPTGLGTFGSTREACNLSPWLRRIVSS